MFVKVDSSQERDGCQSYLLASISHSSSSTYFIPSSLFLNLLCLFLPPLHHFYIFVSDFVTKHCPPPSVHIPLCPFYLYPLPPLILHFVSMSLQVNRSSVKANLNFIQSITWELGIKRKRGRLPLSLTLSFFLSLSILL